MLRAATEGRTREEEQLAFPPLAVVPQEGPAPEHVDPAASSEAITFDAFFETEYPRLLRAMYLCTGDRHEAEELAQDTFVRALERWDRVRAADNRAGYLYRMAVNLYRSKLRRIARGARKAVAPPEDPDPYQAADDRDVIGRALRALPDGQRDAVVMVQWLGMSDDEAGDLLGVSPITVRVRIHRARATMRPILRAGDGP